VENCLADFFFTNKDELPFRTVELIKDYSKEEAQ
jgi:hypothetical protein